MTVVACACGCGTEIPALTKQGKSARYSKGHNARGIRFSPATRAKISEARRRRPAPVTADRMRGKFVVVANGCWEWTASKYGNGYGHLRIDRKGHLAHRVSYELYVGPIPKGLDLDHLCRNRACVNPDHLEPVTRSENLRRGSGTKLSAEDVAEIRRAAGSMSNAEIGRRFAVTSQHIGHVIRGATHDGRPLWSDA